MKVMNRSLLAMLVAVTLLTMTREAAAVPFGSDNVSGGENLIDANIDFQPGLDLVVVIIGSYDLEFTHSGGNNRNVSYCHTTEYIADAGTYVYYPAIGTTYFSGVYTNSNRRGPMIAITSGSVTPVQHTVTELGNKKALKYVGLNGGGEVNGSAYFQGFGDIDGAHILMSNVLLAALLP